MNKHVFLIFRSVANCNIEIQFRFRAYVSMSKIFGGSVWLSGLPWKSCVNGGGGTIHGTLHNIVNVCRWPFTGDKTTTPLSNPRSLFVIVVTYLLTLIVLSGYTRSRREAMFGHSRIFVRIAAAHNAFLSLFSLWMNVHVSRTILKTPDFKDTICIPRGSDLPEWMQASLYIFLLSKIYELLDTPILIARRRPLSFLHVWHHSTVIFEIWGWVDQKVALGLYGMWFNTAVHVVMYAYYALVLRGYKMRAKILITVSQIIQFVTGFLSLLPFVILHLTRPNGCEGSVGLLLSSLINGSYLILFLIFYRDTYTKPKRPRGAKSHSHEHATTSTLIARYLNSSDMNQRSRAPTVVLRPTASSVKTLKSMTSTPSGSTTAISTSPNLESFYEFEPPVISVPSSTDFPLHRRVVDTPRPDVPIPSARSSRSSLTPEVSAQSIDSPWLGEILASSKSE